MPALKGLALAGLLVAAAGILSACDPSREIILNNTSDQSLVVRVSGYAGSDVETLLVGANSSVTIANYGAGGNEPFLVSQVEILRLDCSVLETVSVGGYQTDEGTIEIGSNLKAQVHAGGNPQAAASPAATNLCLQPRSSDSP